MSTAALAYNEARLLREHFQLIYGSAEATAFVFDSAVTGATLEAWLQTPANLAAFNQLVTTYVGPAALIANGTAWEAVTTSSTAMAAVAASSTAMAAVAASPAAMATFTSSEAVATIRNPVMTSATAPAGVVSVSTMSSSANAGWRAFDGSLASTNTWLSASGSISGQWLQYVFPEPVFIHSLDMTGYVSAPARSVRDFSVQCSADGVSWESVFVGSAPSSGDANFRRFSFGAAGKWRYWRIVIANNNGDASYVGITEANFVGFDV